MAAGIVYSNYTTATGVTFLVGRWVPDTSTPLVNAIGIHALVKTDGTPLDFGAGTGGAATQRMIIDGSQFGNLGIAAKAGSVPSVLATDQPTIAIAHDTTQLMKGASGAGVTPVSVAIVASASGATAIVAAQGASNKIRVIQWDAKVNAAVNFKWQSAANDLTGLYYNSAQGDGVARAFSPVGYFTTNANEALNINLSGAVAVGGVLTYVVVT